MEAPTFDRFQLDKALARIDEMKYGKDFHLVATPKMVTPEPTPKSRRAFWTDEEVQRLQELFQINPYPDQQAKRQLSEELQKELSKITNWFKNERARKNIKRDGGTPGKKSPEGKVSLGTVPSSIGTNVVRAFLNSNMIGHSIENVQSALVQSDQSTNQIAPVQSVHSGNPATTKLVLVNSSQPSTACNLGSSASQGQSGSILGQMKNEYDTPSNTPLKPTPSGLEDRSRPEALQIKKRKLSTDLGVSDLSNSPPKGKLEMENWRNNFVSMSKSELLEMISNLEIQLNEAEDKITMSTHLQAENKDLKSLIHHYSEWNNKLNSEMNETRIFFKNMISNKETDEINAMKHQMECLRKENACLRGEIEIVKGRENHNF